MDFCQPGCVWGKCTAPLRFLEEMETAHRPPPIASLGSWGHLGYFIAASPASLSLGWLLGTWPPLTCRLVEGEGVEWTGPHPWKPPSVQLSGVSEGLGRGEGCSGQGTTWQAGPSVEAENPGVLGHSRGLSSHLPGQDRGGCCWACAIQRFFHLCLTLTEGPSTRWGRHSLLGLGQKPNHCHPVGMPTE